MGGRVVGVVKSNFHVKVKVFETPSIKANLVLLCYLII